jgi:hypothetical protein
MQRSHCSLDLSTVSRICGPFACTHGPTEDMSIRIIFLASRQAYFVVPAL